MSYLRPKIWEWIPSEIAAIESLPGFKEKIKKEEHNECPCRLGKVFISNAGFILNQSIVGFQLVKESSRLVGDAKEPCWLVFRVDIERAKITWSDIVLVSLLLALYCVKSVQRRSFFWSLFSCIWTKYKDLIRKSLYSVQIRENTDQKKFRIWTLFAQCWIGSAPFLLLLFVVADFDSFLFLLAGLYSSFVFKSYTFTFNNFLFIFIVW